MLLLSLFVGVGIFTAGGTALLTVNTTSPTTTSSTTTSPTTATPTTIPATTTTTTLHTTMNSMILNATTHTTTTKNFTNTTTPFQMYPVVAGLRALVRSSVELDINQANSILQQYLVHLSSYYNVTARITSIKKV